MGVKMLNPRARVRSQVCGSDLGAEKSSLGLVGLVKNSGVYLILCNNNGFSC